MQVLSLRVEHFRNLSAQEHAFCAGFNVITGDNAQGKTNLLEALYYLSALHSFRSRHNEALIAHGEPRALLEGEFQRGELRYSVRIILEQKSRKVWCNGKPLRSADEFLGALPMVLFTPDDLQLLKGPPQLRRQFLDRLIVQLRPGYATLLKDYHRCLKQRNAQLTTVRGIPWEDPAHQAYLQELVTFGAQITLSRLELTRDLAPLVAPLVADVSQQQDALSLSYRSTCAAGVEALDVIRRSLLAGLTRSFPLDRRSGITSVGPHRDDLDVMLNDLPLREHASQGQHRSVVLALKGAEIHLLAQRKGAPPILLLDDLSSELDERRRSLLFSHLVSTGGQVFLTGTEPRLISLLPPGERLWLSVTDGAVNLSPMGA